jgi:hypothetical protein
MQKKNLLTLFIVILFTSLFSVYYIKPKLHQRFCGSFCFRSKQPAPYYNANYFSKKFINDSFAYPPCNLDKKNSLFVQDFNSKFINSKEGHRFTPDQPKNPEKTIWMFGGSSLANVEVPDSMTIPSYLQNEFVKKNIKVENYGYAGAQINHQFQKLKTLKTHPGDLIIFYDGINESIASMIMQHDLNPTSDSISESELTASFSGFKKFIVSNLQRLRQFLNAVHFFRFWFGDDPIFILQNQVPDHLTNPTTIKNIQYKMENQLLKQLVEINQYCKENQLIFIHVFQPILNLTTHQTSYEKKLILQPSIIPKTFDIAFQNSSIVFQNLTSKLNLEKIQSYDLTNSLGGRKINEEIFLDYGHLNHYGNELISKQIIQIIEKSQFTYSLKPYIDLFHSLDGIVVDHVKASNFKLKQNIKNVCDIVPKEILNSPQFVEDLLNWEEKISDIFFTNKSGDRDQYYWQRVLLRWMIELNCRGRNI